MNNRKESQRQAELAYRERCEQQGLVKVCVTVPKCARDDLLAFAAHQRKLWEDIQ